MMRLVSSTILLFSWFTFVTTSIDLDTADRYRCTFDVDVICGWTIEGPVYNGPGGCDYGWPDNATQGATAPGMYMCFYLEDLLFNPDQFPGADRARLISPTINVTQHVVLGFSIGTVRPPASTYLRVLLMNDTDTNGTETLLCSTSELLYPWQRIYVGIVQPGPYKIVIEGIPDPSFYPNFGIDELTLTAVENATANVGVQTTTCSTELVTTPRMTTRQYNTTLSMTSSQDTTKLPMTSSHDPTTQSTASSQDTITQLRTSQDTTTLPMTSQDTTTQPMSSQDTTEQPMTSSQDTTTLPVTIDLDTADQYRCSFDANVCDWTIEGPVFHGGPAGCDHGWPDDALHGSTTPGMYSCFYLESLELLNRTDLGLGRARLISPTISVTQHVVLGFAVGTVRQPTSTYLRVLLVNETDTNSTETLMCSTSDLLFPWQRIYVGIVQPGPYKIVIEGIPDPPFYPNFGVDELTLTVVENATANVGVQTTTCSTKLVTTPRMTTRQYNATHPMTSSQDDTTIPVAVSQITTTFSQTSSQETTILPMTSSHNTTILPMTSSHDTTILPMTSSHDTTILPMSSSLDTTILPMTGSHDTTILPMTSRQDTTTFPLTSSEEKTPFPTTSTHGMSTFPKTSSQDTTTLPTTTSQDRTTLLMTSKQEETTQFFSNPPSAKTTNRVHLTTGKDETTSGISKHPTSKTTPPEETTKRPIPDKTLLTTYKPGEVVTKSLPTNTTSKEGQVGQQSGRSDTPDITALPIVLGIAGFLMIAAGAMFYLRKRNKRSNFSVEESRRASRMTLTQTELTEL